MAFGQLSDYLVTLDLLRPMYSAEKRKEAPPRRLGIGMGTQNTCAKFHGLSVINVEDISTFVRKTCVFRVVVSNYLSLV